MLSLLITLLIAALVIYLIYYILGMLTLPAGVRQIVMIVVGIIALIWIIQLVFGGAGLPSPTVY